MCFTFKYHSTLYLKSYINFNNFLLQYLTKNFLSGLVISNKRYKRVYTCINNFVQKYEHVYWQILLINIYISNYKIHVHSTHIGHI